MKEMIADGKLRGFSIDSVDELDGWLVLHEYVYKPGVLRFHVANYVGVPQEFRMVYWRYRDDPSTTS